MQPVQVDGMSKHNETGLSVSGCMQPDIVCLNYADILRPLAVALVNGQVVMVNLTKKELLNVHITHVAFINRGVFKKYYTQRGMNDIIEKEDLSDYTTSDIETVQQVFGAAQ